MLALLAKTIAAFSILLTSCQHSQAPDSGYASVASATSCHARHTDMTDPQGWLPDPRCTPGKANPAVTIGQLCPVAHTKQWRPPASYTNDLKRQQLASYDYVDSVGPHTVTAADSEEDHLISLELGGDPRDPSNLWPEPHSSYNHKDAVESATHSAVCRGALSLLQAQQGIAADWIGLGKRLNVKY